MLFPKRCFFPFNSAVLFLNIVAFLVFGNGANAEDLQKKFAQPPDSAKPHVWWHWMNGNITKNGITADLEAMAGVGIGGAQIFEPSESIPHGPIQFNSPQWRELVLFAAKEARRLGLELGIHNCAGWSSSGGPWTTPAQSMKMVVASEERVKGPSQFAGAMPQPQTKMNWYRDIAVLAFPTPSVEMTTMRAASAKISSSNGDQNAANAADGNYATLAVLGQPAVKKPAFLQFEFAKPFTARTLAMLVPGEVWQDYQGQLEASADGGNYRPIQTFSFKFGDLLKTVAFKPITAKAFRVVFINSPSPVVLAEAELSPKRSIADLSEKTFLTRTPKYRESATVEASSDAVVQGDRIVNLTDKMTAGGKLAWDVPKGDWTILRIGYTPTGAINCPAPPEGTGLECDKLNRDAVQAHWDAIMGPLIAKLGPFAGNAKSGLNNVLIDSYERGSQNWTHGFEKEFQKRRGYDMMRYLPVFAGRVVDNSEITERFLWDLRRTIADLFAENYSGKFAEMAHRSGLKYSVEPYGNCPTDDLQYGSRADIPMSEFWVGKEGHPDNAKLAASVGHVFGRQVIGAESFTARPNDGKWQQEPFTLKASGDAAYCAGVNRIIIHRYAHQPWTNPTRYPGMTMGPWGTHFERTTTWWKQSTDWIRYQTRCQCLLQQGQFVADVCFYCGEDAPNSVVTPKLPHGYDYDVCETTALKSMSVQNGRILTPSGMNYRILVLPNRRTMTPTVLRKVAELAKAGATIIGPKPNCSPSLTDYPACDVEVKKTADAIWPNVVHDISPAEALASLNVLPDFVCTTQSSNLRYIHRFTDKANIYFVSNQNHVSDDVECTFRMAGKIPEFWHSDTGRIEKAPVFVEKNGRTTVPLHFDSAESVFVVFRQPINNADHAVAIRRTTAAEATIVDDPAESMTILKAEYGAFHDKLPNRADLVGDKPFLEKKVVDVTARLATLAKNGAIRVKADNQLAKNDPAFKIAKELRVQYCYRGQRKEMRIPEGGTLSLPPRDDRAAPTPVYDIALKTAAADADQLEITAWKPGSFVVTMASGKTLQADVADVPKPTEITGPWELNFPPHWGAPEKISLDKLTSWTEHANQGVRYFSGTAVYRKTFAWPRAKQQNERYLLDLGDLRNIAEVDFNGHSLGILWKPPYRIDITDLLETGNNTLAVKITNLWPNRLIGDEQLPDDGEWSGPAKWPQWVVDGNPSPTGRVTFTTWHHWMKDDEPLPSGLFGPVLMRTAKTVALQ